MEGVFWKGRLRKNFLRKPRSSQGLLLGLRVVRDLNHLQESVVLWGFLNGKGNLLTYVKAMPLWEGVARGKVRGNKTQTRELQMLRGADQTADAPWGRSNMHT